MTERKKLVEFARRVHELGTAGATQEEVCERLGVALGTIRYRLAKLGLTLAPGTSVVDVRTREPLPALIERGVLDSPAAEAVA